MLKRLFPYLSVNGSMSNVRNQSSQQLKRVYIEQLTFRNLDILCW